MEHVVLTNGNLRAEVLDIGAFLVSLSIDGVDLTLRHADLTRYGTDDDAYLGALVGRFANRIANGRYVLDGREIEVERNNGGHHLHGGSAGCSRQRWEVRDRSATSVSLECHSPSGASGHPGGVDLACTYTLDADRLRLDVRATCDAPTLVNLAQHSYWNLSGSRSSIGDHRLTVDAGAVLAVDGELIPTGEIRSVAGTDFDLRAPTLLADRIGSIEPTIGYDHCFVLDEIRGDSGLRRAARLEHPSSGRWLEIHTDQPALQVYTANMFTDPHTAICLEPQGFPNSPNEPSFPSAVLRPGEVYAQRFEAVVGRRPSGED